MRACWSAAGILPPGSPLRVPSPGLHVWRDLCWNTPARRHSLPSTQPRVTAQSQQLSGPEPEPEVVSDPLPIPGPLYRGDTDAWGAAGPRSFKAGPAGPQSRSPIFHRGFCQDTPPHPLQGALSGEHLRPALTLWVCWTVLVRTLSSVSVGTL